MKINNRINIFDLKTSKKISLKKFKEDNIKEINQKYLPFNSIINRKILTKTKLEQLITSRVLEEVKIKNKRYIDRAELFNVLSKK